MSSTPASPVMTGAAAGPAGPTPDKPAVRVRGLRKTFGPVVAVDSLALTVAPGEVVAFLGPNGAGKSTTLDVVLGFTRPDAGTAAVLGVAPREAVRAGRVGAVLQADGLNPSFTVRQTLDIIASLQLRIPDIESVIAQTRLEGLLRRKISQCSGGEIQRVRLALALLAQPELLVLDEPTTGMDPTARAAFWEMMRRETAQGRAILFATHYLQEAADVADRIIIIDRGRLVAEGSVDEVRALGEGTTVTATWLGLSGEAELRAVLAPVADSLLGMEVHGSHLELRTSAPDDVARLLLTATPAGHIGVMALSLEEIFAQLVGHDHGHDHGHDRAAAPAA